MELTHNKDGTGKAQMAPRTLWALGTALFAVYFLGALARSGVAFEGLAAIPKPYVLILKGCAEALLVIAAFMGAQSRNGRKLALYIFVIFIADMALGLGLIPVSGAIFVLAHIYAAFLYFKSPDLSASSLMKFVGTLPLLFVIAACGYWIFKGAFQIMAVFPIFSAIAAFAALRSTYPKVLLGVGTCVLWVSDIAFVMAVPAGVSVTGIGWLIWLTFATGYAMMVFGLIKGPIE